MWLYPVRHLKKLRLLENAWAGLSNGFLLMKMISISIFMFRSGRKILLMEKYIIIMACNLIWVMRLPVTVLFIKMKTAGYFIPILLLPAVASQSLQHICCLTWHQRAAMKGPGIILLNGFGTTTNTIQEVM